MSKQKIAVVGDWDEGIEHIKSALLEGGYEPMVIDLSDLRATVRKRGSDVMILVVKESSDAVLQKIKDVQRINEALPLFLYSNDVDVRFIVSAVKQGVNDFFVPPLDTKAFVQRVDRELHLYQLTKKIFMTNSSQVDDFRFERMIGRSKAMQDNFQMIAAVAKSNATVLITGESGVGKELVARAIHRCSERAAERFVDINCGAIPNELLENELFGHEKGAFTGAHKMYQGSFEVAHRGSLFLDEISEMDVMLQVKLLRALQERTINRIGSNDTIKVDVRIIAATNRNLMQQIEQGRFREDLFYRLNVVNIDIPSLRERREDIPLLAKHFLEYYSAKNNRIFLDFSTDAMEALINYDWPGNVRELENTIERLVVLHDSSEVKLKHLPPNIQKVDCSIGYSNETVAPRADNNVIPLEDLERRAIEAALIKFQGNITVAAKKLKIGQATLYRKVKKFGLQNPNN
ncbi:MAG: sigma-54-dependent Fis family transcriptional regulator [Deltaproteobacteria bacterium]|nr:sigma-54-dependent Fis family transcriptional regulator [Deltaproteobacteria bacterium]